MYHRIVFVDRLYLPSALVLSNCGITKAGDGLHIAAFCAHVVELDLSHNQLNDWLEVRRPSRVLKVRRGLLLTDTQNAKCSLVSSNPVTARGFPDLHHRVQRPPLGFPQSEHEPSEQRRADAHHRRGLLPDPQTRPH